MKSKGIFFAAIIIVFIVGAFHRPAGASAAQSASLATTAAEHAKSLPSMRIAFSTPMPCDNSAYVKDITVPDNTQIDPGTSFIKKWKIKNMGSCAWTKKFSLQFASGEKMSGETTYLTQWIPPDQVVIISVEMTAPERAGTYTGYWIMVDGNGSAFGCYVYVKIRV